MCKTDKTTDTIFVHRLKLTKRNISYFFKSLVLNEEGGPKTDQMEIQTLVTLSYICTL